MNPHFTRSATTTTIIWPIHQQLSVSIVWDLTSNRLSSCLLCRLCVTVYCVVSVCNVYANRVNDFFRKNMYSAFTSYQLNCQDMKLHLDMAESNRRAHYIHVSPYIKWDGKNKYERRTKYLNYKVIKKFDGTCSTIGHSRIPNLSLWENIFCFFFVSLESKKKIRIHYPLSFNRFLSSCHDVVKLFSSRAAIVNDSDSD